MSVARATVEVDPERHQQLANEAIWNYTLPRGLQQCGPPERIDALPAGLRDEAFLREFPSEQYPYSISATVYEPESDPEN
jgi:hypothetical protein